MVRVPPDLGPEGRKLWRDTVKRMAENDAAPDVREQKILHSACQLTDTVVTLKAALDADQPFTTGSRGQTVIHPAVGEIRATHHEIAALLFRIDLDPFADEAAGSVGITITPQSRSVKARNAANVRWGK